MKHLTLKELQQMLDKVATEYNNAGRDEFEGLSPTQMAALLYNPFGENGPVVLKPLDKAALQQVPMLQQTLYLAGLIREQDGLKLTAKGALPVKTVAAVYAKGFLQDPLVERGFQKLYKESDTMVIPLARFLLELAGVTTKRKNTLFLSRNGKKLIDDPNALLGKIFTAFATRFNWGYFDRYDNPDIGMLGFAFSLLLLHKYGNEKREDHFYAGRYLKAYPALLNNPTPPFGTPYDHAAHCYSLRTFDRFLEYFGLVETEQGAKWDDPKYITRTPVFDRFIGINL